MIQVEGVTKRYGPKTAVSNISFEVERGEIVGFLGPNGAGKTTTMRILTGFLPPTQGTASVAGFDVGKSPIEVKRRIGYLPESPPLYPEMEVGDYLRFVAAIKRIPKKEIPRRVDAVLERTATGAVRDLLVGKLSKGYRQRVGLAQALIHGPEVLVLDEPTSGLDPKQIIEVRGLIRSLAGEHTILLSTHILPEVAGTCGRVIIINEGRIEASDTPENLTSQLQGANSLLLDIDGPVEEVRERLELDLAVRKVVEHEARDGRMVWRVEADKDENLTRRLAEAVVTSGWGLYEMQSLGLSLEDIFLKLTSDESAAVQAEEEMPEPEAAESDTSAGEGSESGEGEDE
ncbi:MAG: ABC transporter ATP-binding protein [Bryobacterales bacterium]|nr:ABC transporter ATP-binding protein [Bryobacterales bacterium]MDE0264994.1 ABC transporter ATP-binding protein [Bryobacterales bacterium]MDE0620053.1 ABC transporter ATP-binding protein [Bryobacterales bacterium]